MRKVRCFIWMGLMMAVSWLFLSGENIKAENVDFSRKYSGNDSWEDEYDFRLKCRCEMTISMEFAGNCDTDYLDVDLWADSDDEDEVETSLFYKTIRGRGTYKKTITLPAGEYNIAIVHDIDEDFYDDYDEDEDEDDIWDESENVQEKAWYSVTLSGQYIPELSTNDITLKEGEEKALKVKGAKESVKWKSSDKSVASVSSKGVVKAKKPGKATITATCGKHTLKCKVTVEKKPVTYSFLSKKLKEFAKKNKSFTFKTIDAGRRARLSAKAIGATESSKIESEGYAMFSYMQPYIEIVKRKNSVEMSLKIEGYLEVISINSTTLHCSKIRLYTSNRRMNLAMTQTSASNRYNYSTYIYTGKMKGYATVSTSSKVNDSVLKKFNTMLGQSSLFMRTESLDGAYFGGGITTQVRNNWQKLVKEYNTLLKEY